MNCFTPISARIEETCTCLSENETIIYAALFHAAENGLACPYNLDLEDLIDCSSASVGASIVARLERKGLLRVIRYQRFRRVQIVATGKWTAPAHNMHQLHPHVPRGARSRGPVPTDRKPFKTRIR